jgi:hypothetical protein
MPAKIFHKKFTFILFVLLELYNLTRTGALTEIKILLLLSTVFGHCNVSLKIVHDK